MGRILNTEFCIEEIEEDQINPCTKAENELRKLSDTLQ